MNSRPMKKLSKNNGKSLMWYMLIDYTHEILFPAMAESFPTKREFEKFRDESFTTQDDIIKKLDLLLQEKKIADYQHEKEKQFFLIITKALADHKILDQSQLKAITELEVFEFKKGLF